MDLKLSRIRRVKIQTYKKCIETLNKKYAVKHAKSCYRHWNICGNIGVMHILQQIMESTKTKGKKELLNQNTNYELLF